MASDYERILQLRHDTTQWLLHFTHNAPDPNDPPFGCIYARDVLAKILIDGALHPGWSRRNGRNTIYGPRPAVCFTEMPLLAFCQYLDARSNTGLISGYGVILHKKQVFAEGGLPAIYESHIVELEPGDTHYAVGQRIVDSTHFPLNLQYRLVATNLGADRPIDWTHEREWRWPQQANHQGRATLSLAGSGWYGGKGASIGQPHVFVLNDADIPWLQQQLASSIPPAGSSNDHNVERYRQHLRESVGVISLDHVRRMVTSGQPAYARLDSWPSSALVDIAGTPGKKRAAGELFIHTD